MSKELKVLVFLWICALAFMVLIMTRADAQVAVVPATLPKFQFLDQNGNPLSGGLLYTYAAGTSTPLETYTDSSGTIMNTNPITLDAGGWAQMWLKQASYKFVLKNSLGAQLWTIDNIPGAASTSAYRTIQGNGVSQVQREIFNLKSSNGSVVITCSDNSFTSTTDCDLASVSGTITVGQLVCGAATTYPLTGCNLSGDVTTSGSTAATIAANAVTTGKIADGAVTTAKIADGAVTEGKQTLADVTTNNVSITAHGYVPKAPNDTSKWLRGDASWQPLPNSGKIDMFWSFTGCALGTGQPNSCSGTASLPSAMPDTGYYVLCTANSGNAATVYLTITGSLTTTSFPYRGTLDMVNGTGGSTPIYYCHAHHD